MLCRRSGPRDIAEEAGGAVAVGAGWRGACPLALLLLLLLLLLLSGAAEEEEEEEEEGTGNLLALY